MVRLSLRKRPKADAEVEAVGVELVEQPVGGVQAQPDAGCGLAEVGEQRGTEQHLHAVRQPDPEQPLGGPGVERLVPGHQGRDLGEGDPHRIDQGEGAGGGAHALRSPGQELVAEQCAQAGEVVAHGRLPEADAGRGARDAALREQRVEGDEQVQVDAAQIDVVDGHHRSNLFD